MILHYEGHPGRFTELYEEEEREERDRDEQEDKNRDSRRETHIYAILYFQSVLRSADTQKDSQNCIGKRRGMEEIGVF